MGVTLTDIQTAHQRTQDLIRVTPVMNLGPNAFNVNASLNLKLELFQHSGSFKARGAFNTIRAHQEAGTLPESGVIAASGGNHGAAVAHAAKTLGVNAEIFVPTISSPVKVQRLRDLGANVQQVGSQYAEALEACQIRQRETGALNIHAYDAPLTLAGAGTVALEWDAQTPDLETVLVAVGGGGLIGGMLAWWQGRVKVVAVEPERCPTLHRSLEAGERVAVDVSGIAMDALGSRTVGELMFPIAQQHLHSSVLVTDDAIAQAQQRLWNDCRILAEPGGATALAALLAGAYQPQPGERVGVLVCGGNTGALP